MFIRQLHLSNFKNIEETTLEFSPKANCLLGNNGMGKSNLMDAIYYLSFCKSFTGVQDQMVVRQGEQFAVLNAKYLRKDIDEAIDVGIFPGRRKSFKRGGKEYTRLSEHIGLFPLVMISAMDMDLVTGTGEERRKFIDMIIAQSDPNYLDALIRYNKSLQQRNSLLRQEANGTEGPLFDAIEIGMAMAATTIHSLRAQKIKELSEIFQQYYRMIAPDELEVGLEYESHLNAPGVTMENLLLQSRERDRYIRHTTVGVHRDDIIMTLGGLHVRKTASQGQSKTFTIALRLAQYEFMARTTGFKPILLLDDIFDKLDATRVERIMSIVAKGQFGQIFVTDTNRQHLDSIMQHIGGDYRLWSVDHGTFTLLGEQQADKLPE